MQCVSARIVNFCVCMYSKFYTTTGWHTTASVLRCACPTTQLLVGHTSLLVFLRNSATLGTYVDVRNKRGMLLRMRMYKSTSHGTAPLQGTRPPHGYSHRRKPGTTSWRIETPEPRRQVTSFTAQEAWQAEIRSLRGIWHGNQYEHNQHLCFNFTFFERSFSRSRW